MSVFVCFCLFVCVGVHVFVLFVSAYLYGYFYLFVCVCVYVYMSVCLFSLFLCTFVCLCVYVHVCLFVCVRRTCHRISTATIFLWKFPYKSTLWYFCEKPSYHVPFPHNRLTLWPAGRLDEKEDPSRTLPDEGKPVGGLRRRSICGSKGELLCSIVSSCIVCCLCGNG